MAKFVKCCKIAFCAVFLRDIQQSKQVANESQKQVRKSTRWKWQKSFIVYVAISGKWKENESNYHAQTKMIVVGSMWQKVQSATMDASG